MLREVPSSLLDYLKNARPAVSSSEAPGHREVCRQIKESPSVIGLEKHIELFERRRFVNQHRRTISCHDFIGFYNGRYTVIEVGTSRRANQQLRCAFKIFAMNFDICPALIRVKYGEKGFTHHGIENARKDYDALMKLGQNSYLPGMKRPEFKGCCIWT